MTKLSTCNFTVSKNPNNRPNLENIAKKGNTRISNTTIFKQVSATHSNKNDNSVYMGQVGCLNTQRSILSPVGRLRTSIPKWISTGAKEHVLNVIKYGYKLPLSILPDKSCLSNNASARTNAKFVGLEIQKLTALGCVSKTNTIPYVVNPLTVASNKSKKLRLVLDGRHVNPYLHSFKYRNEDSGTARNLFKKGDLGFHFDLKSAYHHLEIFPSHRKYLGFYWESQFYVFNVLPFGIKTAAFIFSKTLRHLVEHWRSQGIRIILYLDDGIAVAENMEKAQKLAKKVKQDLLDFGFIIAADKSDWQPKYVVQWLGHSFDFRNATIFITENRLENIINNINTLIESISINSNIEVRKLASVVGMIQSSTGGVGPISKLMTKFCHMCIECIERFVHRI